MCGFSRQMSTLRFFMPGCMPVLDLVSPLLGNAYASRRDPRAPNALFMCNWLEVNECLGISRYGEPENRLTQYVRGFSQVFYRPKNCRKAFISFASAPDLVALSKFWT